MSKTLQTARVNARRRLAVGLAGMLLGSTALCVAPARADEAPAAVAATSSGVAEVVVTARKRSEKLQDVPIAITAVTGAALSQGQHLQVQDLNEFAPSTNIVIPSPHQTSFSIRGLGANPSNDGLEQSAGVFVDGVYLGRPGMAVFDLIDISQIEMLRGPQGTLYGKNTTAGAVNISTTPPSFTPGATLQVTGGNLGYAQLQGTVTGPLMGDVLAGRLTAYQTSRDGWVRDTTNGDSLDGIHRDGVRGQLLYKPTDHFSLRLIGEYHEENDSNGATLFNSWGADKAAWQKDLAAVGASVDIDPEGTTTAANGATVIRTRQAALSAEANYDFGDGLTLTSITAWRKWSYLSLSDVDGSNVNVLNAGYDVHDQQFSQELRIATPKDKPIEAVAGAYYFQQNLSVDQSTLYGPEADAYLAGIPAALLPVYAQYSAALRALLAYPNTRWDIWGTPHTQSYALFGQGTWHATPKLSVTAGLRETYETKNEDVWRPNPISTVTGQPSAGLAYETYPAAHVGVANWAPSGLVSADYKLTRDVMAYVSVSQGEKAGGVSTTLPGSGLGLNSLKVKPEVAQDLEAGIKSQWFDHRLQLDLDGFYTKVRDYQATYFETPPGGTSTVQVLTNVGRVVTRGVEAELTARPIDGLTLNATGSYNDAYYASYPAGPCPVEISAATCNLTGKPVAGAPRWIANIGGQYEHPVTEAMTGYLEANYSWRSHYYGYLDDSTYDRTGDYGLVDMRVGLKAANGRWDVSVWAKNLGDAHYVASYLSYGSLTPGAYVPFFGDPRTYGLTLRAGF
jgi:iron complex outermembrane receptor protein